MARIHPLWFPIPIGTVLGLLLSSNLMPADEWRPSDAGLDRSETIAISIASCFGVVGAAKLLSLGVSRHY